MTISYKNENVDQKNKKLNRNAYNALRSLLLNTCLQIKTSTFPEVQFSEIGYLS